MTDIDARPTPGPPGGYRLLIAVIGPFVCGYFLSYLLRNVNAVISPDLVTTFQLDASDLGLLKGLQAMGINC